MVTETSSESIRDHVTARDVLVWSGYAEVQILVEQRLVGDITITISLQVTMVTQGWRYWSPLSPNLKKKYFWHKQNYLAKTSGEKKSPLKKSAPKNAT